MFKPHHSIKSATRPQYYITLPWLHLKHAGLHWLQISDGLKLIISSSCHMHLTTDNRYRCLCTVDRRSTTTDNQICCNWVWWSWYHPKFIITSDQANISWLMVLIFRIVCSHQFLKKEKRIPQRKTYINCTSTLELLRAWRRSVSFSFCSLFHSETL